MTRELSRELCFLLSNLQAIRSRISGDDLEHWLDGAVARASYMARLVVGIAADPTAKPRVG